MKAEERVLAVMEGQDSGHLSSVKMQLKNKLL